MRYIHQETRTAAGQNGFSIANFRLKLYGDLDGGFAYCFQTNFLKSPGILDGYIPYTPLTDITIDAGLMKAPFSKEYLTSAADIDFVNRSQVISALNLGRQVGLKVRGVIGDGVLKYSTGIFNGNNNPNGNNDASFLVAGRISLFPFGQSENEKLEIGINGGRSKEEIIQNFFLFNVTRNIAGVDFRWTHDRLLLSGEYVMTEYRSSAAAIIRPEGFHVTGGYAVTNNSQILIRYDSYRPHGLGVDSDMIVAGYNLWPTSVTGIQANILFPTNNTVTNKLQLLLNAQVSI